MKTIFQGKISDTSYSEETPFSSFSSRVNSLTVPSEYEIFKLRIRNKKISEFNVTIFFSSVLAEMGRHDESIDVLNEIINSNSSEQRAKVTALINKGLLYCIKMDRKDDASLIFKEAVKE